MTFRSERSGASANFPTSDQAGAAAGPALPWPPDWRGFTAQFRSTQ
ncbi:MAG: hypothetical protein OXG81_10930 [Acidobacteria bacterium]|nr:hypothetical protein [Acidobacteriota bacterium]